MKSLRFIDITYRALIYLKLSKLLNSNYDTQENLPEIGLDGVVVTIPSPIVEQYIDTVLK